MKLSVPIYLHGKSLYTPQVTVSFIEDYWFKIFMEYFKNNYKNKMFEVVA